MAINIVIPMAGKGQRFRDAGYEDPKPFIEVEGKRMIESVIENLNSPTKTAHSRFKYIFICHQEFLDQFRGEFYKILDKYCYDYEVLSVSKTTEGAACTVLIAQDLINNNDELIITDCDHLADSGHILSGVNFFRRKKADGGTWNFISDDPKYSYVRLNNGKIIEIAEKQVISNLANTGSYYFAKGKDFVHSAKEMILKNDRTRGEFYVAPVYRYLIVDGKKVIPYIVNEFHGLGTPNDLNDYLKRDK